MKPAPTTNDASRLVRLIDEGYNRKSWHGTNLRGSVRGLTAAQAAWRSGRHSIADLVVHCAYWKYAVRRRLRGEKRGSFGLKGSNWFALAEPLTPAAWKEYFALLDAEHAALRSAVSELTPGQIAATRAGSQVSNLMLLHGVAMHDVYHAGQIQMIKGAHRGAQRE